jgi:hypothetical protein
MTKPPVSSRYQRCNEVRGLTEVVDVLLHSEALDYRSYILVAELDLEVS